MEKRIKSWIKENWWWLFGLIFIVGILIWLFSSLSLPETKQWCDRPLSELRVIDVLIIVIVHAWINRSENKCNYKSDRK